jgi:hypothetical protein
MRSNNSSAIPGTPLVDKSFFLYALICVLALFGGIRFDVVGVLFFSDILIAGLFAITIAYAILSPPPRFYPVELLVLWIFPVVGVVIDLFDATPGNDLLRGVARNCIFVAAAWLSFTIASKLSLYKGLLFYFLLILSVLITTVQTDPTAVYSLSNLFKNDGAMALPYLILLVALSRTTNGSGIFLVLGGVFLWQIDFRGYSFVFALAGLIILFRRIIRSIPVWQLILIGCVGFVALYYLFSLISYSVAPDSSTISRRRESGEERETMLVDAWRGFVAEPFTGNGSWQHARNYISVLQIEEVDQVVLVGVHSAWLQLAYEYGIFGVIVGGYVFMRGVQALLIVLSTNWATTEKGLLRAYPSALLMILTLCYDWVAGPFAGATRIYHGLGFGLCLYIVGRAKAKNGISAAAEPARISLATRAIARQNAV